MAFGIVLGGGGVLGAAWAVGALTAIEAVDGVDARDAEVILGTSAGSVMTAMLAGGLSVANMRAHQSGGAITEGPLAGYLWDYDVATGAATPPSPRWRGASPSTFLRNAVRLRTMPPTAVVAPLLPEGRASIASIRELAHTSVGGLSWPDRDGIWINAFNLDFGFRVVFGTGDAPPADIADAVAASCSIPGWYEPVLIDGTRYVDGGTWSATSADLLRDQRLDHVYVLAPMASFDLDHPHDVSSTLERVWRLRVTKRLIREVGRLRRTGMGVTVLAPTATDLAVMGSNFMDPARRPDVLTTSLQTSELTMRAASQQRWGTYR
jgi:NTE family protein